jgi:hypothetical protein
MKNTFSLLSKFILLSILTISISCKKDLNPQMHYFFKSSASNEIDFLKFNFSLTRAYVSSSVTNIDTAIRSVYLTDKIVKLGLKDNENLINLGSSDIEDRAIYGYDLFLNESQFFKNGLLVKFQDNGYCKIPFTPINFTPENNKSYNVFFEIDVDKSLMKESSGELKFVPNLKITVEGR